MPERESLPDFISRIYGRATLLDIIRCLETRPRVNLEPQEDTVPALAEFGYDGSRLRRRYWKKVRER